MSTSETVAQPAAKRPTLSGSGLIPCAKTENTLEKSAESALGEVIWGLMQAGHRMVLCEEW